jgi:hypothetical protein
MGGGAITPNHFSKLAASNFLTLNYESMSKAGSMYPSTPDRRHLAREHSKSYDKKIPVLNQNNLEVFNKQNNVSKDLHYAKIFAAPSESDTNFFQSHSLFAYNCGLEEDYN